MIVKVAKEATPQSPLAEVSQFIFVIVVRSGVWIEFETLFFLVMFCLLFFFCHGHTVVGAFIAAV